MNKKIINARTKEQAEELQRLLTAYTGKTDNSAQDTESLMLAMNKLYRSLAVNSFLLEDKELSGDLNVHLKIMEVVNKQDEVKVEINPDPIKDTVIEEPKPEIVEKPQTSIQFESPEIVSNEIPVTEPVEAAKPSKRLEIGINDKFRMINELFNQNNSEYATAIEQLNLCANYEEAERYLNSVKNLYGWKDDLPILKTLYSLTQKRFV